MASAALFRLILQHPDVVKPPTGSGEAVAWCPWHPDRDGRTPNLGINERKGVVKCWVCGKGGAKALARAWGIQDPERDGRKRTAPEPLMSAEAAMQGLRDA